MSEAGTSNVPKTPEPRPAPSKEAPKGPNVVNTPPATPQHIQHPALPGHDQGTPEAPKNS